MSNEVKIGQRSILVEDWHVFKVPPAPTLMNLSEAVVTSFKLAGTEVQGRLAFHKSKKAWVDLVEDKDLK